MNNTPLDTQEPTQSKETLKRTVKSSVPKKVAKVVLVVAVSLVLLLSAVLCGVVWILNPERLTPMSVRMSNDMLNAEVSISRLELTAWATFPYLTIEADTLTVVSGSLGSLPQELRAALPANADSLLSLTHARAGLNVFKMLVGNFSLHDVEVDNLFINLVAADEQTANYLIAYSEEGNDSEDADEALVLPAISWNAINLRGDTRIAYFGATDTLDVKCRIDSVASLHCKDDTYQLSIAVQADCAMGGVQLVENLGIGINGYLEWSYKHPLTIGLTGVQATVHDFPVSMDMHLAMDTGAEIDLFDLTAGPAKLSSLKEIMPREYSNMLASVKSDMAITLTARLTETYNMLDTILPSVDITLKIPQSYLATTGSQARLDKVVLDAEASIRGNDIDASWVSVNQLTLGSEALELEVSGKATRLASDMRFTGDISGTADIGKVVSALNLPVTFTVEGEVEAYASIEAKMSDFTANTFQNMSLDGDISVRNLYYNSIADTLSVYARNAELKFGNKSSLTLPGGNEIASLLHFSSTVDTLSASMAGMSISLSDGVIGAGCVGDEDAVADDTTRIIPIGARVRAGKLAVMQADSTKIGVRGLDCGGSISRFEGDAHRPKISLSLGADGLAYLSKQAGLMLRDSRIAATASVQKRDNSRPNPFRQRVEKLRAEHPDWSNDTILKVASQGFQHPDKSQKIADGQIVDLSVDRSFHRMLMAWQLAGSITGKSGRMFTPYFPLRSSMSDVDITFSTDSVIFRNANLKMGQSQFHAQGGIRNLRNTLLGRTRDPLSLIFVLKADTINVNQLIQAAYDGAAYADQADGSSSLLNASSEDELDAIADDTAVSADSTIMAFVIPSNIDATFALRASNILYTDLVLNTFNGDLMMRDGVLNLHDLNANTDMGTAEFNAFYAAPDRTDIKCGFDLSLTEIQLGKLIKLIPAIDSIMPLLESIDGVVDADLAVTTNVDSLMNVLIPTTKAAMKIHGRDLVFMDAETFRKVAKMLLFKNKEKNTIDEMTVEMLLEDGQMELFPFKFDVDRYRLGVLGYNDLDLNFRYHISVLKSPIPFKFGINIYGNPDDMHFRFGGAKYKDTLTFESVKIVDTTRINLREQINTAFSRGAKAALKSDLNFNNRPSVNKDLQKEAVEDANFTHEDSLQMIEGGFIEAPAVPDTTATAQDVALIPASATAAEAIGSLGAARRREPGDVAILPMLTRRKDPHSSTEALNRKNLGWMV